MPIVLRPVERAGPTNLPPELVHRIMTMLKNTDNFTVAHRSLAACTLFCKAWHDVARSHLFKDVFVRSPPSGFWFDEFFAFVEQHPHVAQYIQNLLFMLDNDWAANRRRNGLPAAENDGDSRRLWPGMAMLNLPSLVATLPRLTALRSLKFMSIALRPHGLPLTPFPISLRTMLVNAPVTPLELFFSGLTIESVDVLYLDSINPRHWPGHAIPRVSVRKLILRCAAVDIPLFDFYQQLFRPEVLRCVDYQSREWPRIRRFCAFLGVMGGRLEQIVLDFRASSIEEMLSSPAVLPWDVIGRAVASCTTLETVEIRLDVIGRLPPTPFRSIPNITALLNELVRLPVLRQLTLRIMNNPAAGGPGDRGGYCEEIMADLTCLDGICTEVVKQVKSMRHVRIFVEGYLFREGRTPFRMPDWETRKRVQDALPTLKATGVGVEVDVDMGSKSPLVEID
ncbi:hypothetical protein C8Q76DRAFT_780925 [Earliella scabrosa]|nr:hypothetical protein C8Q76DRAFT_780925 [Earliella scabrosa]